jgi:hypothetical protein
MKVTGPVSPLIENVAVKVTEPPLLEGFAELVSVTVRTVKAMPLDATPLTVTTTLPVVAPVGTDVRIELLVQLVIVAGVPLNDTVPFIVPKVVPVIVTGVFTAPEFTDRLVMLGATVNDTPLLATPAAVTTTLPVVAPVGTDVRIELLVQLVIVAGIPLNVTVPFVVPKLVPVIVTGVFTAPEFTDRLVMLGATVNDTPLLATPPTQTTTLPVVAPVGTDV